MQQFFTQFIYDIPVTRKADENNLPNAAGQIYKHQQAMVEIFIKRERKPALSSIYETSFGDKHRCH